MYTKATDPISVYVYRKFTEAKRFKLHDDDTPTISLETRERRKKDNNDKYNQIYCEMCMLFSTCLYL